MYWISVVIIAGLMVTRVVYHSKTSAKRVINEIQSGFGLSDDLMNAWQLDSTKHLLSKYGMSEELATGFVDITLGKLPLPNTLIDNSVTKRLTRILSIMLCFAAFLFFYPPDFTGRTVQTR
jgi:hypothetical protein